MGTHYRLLYSKLHFDDWAADLRTSFHHALQEHWMQAWTNGSREIEDFPLEMFDGTYTPQARERFLKAALGGLNMSPTDTNYSSEVAGLCAFASAEAAHKWFAEAPDPEACFLIFEGTFVCKAPDDTDAVVATFVEQPRELLTPAQSDRSSSRRQSNAR
jgi:hypothetical protein